MANNHLGIMTKQIWSNADAPRANLTTYHCVCVCVKRLECVRISQIKKQLVCLIITLSTPLLSYWGISTNFILKSNLHTKGDHIYFIDHLNHLNSQIWNVFTVQNSICVPVPDTVCVTCIDCQFSDNKMHNDCTKFKSIYTRGMGWDRTDIF